MSVMLPYAGVFADVPIMSGLPVPLDITRAGASLAADLDAYTERLDLPLRTKRTPDRIEVSLDTDVLFRLDSADLTPNARKTVFAAAREILSGEPGPLTITGHTDDTGSTAHNQALSKARAATVAKALTEALPDAQWPKTVAGKGETDPAAPNTNAAARRLNRRVTIAYRQTVAQPTPQAAKTELPKTKGVRAIALEGAEIALPLHRGTLRFTARPAKVRGPFLQVDLVARNTGDDKATILDYLGQGIFTARDEFDPYAPYGASGVRMFDGGTLAYGLDYVTDKGGHRCLCDRILNQAIPPGSEQVIALWFPAPPPGTTTVTLDVPDRFRLTDVPVAG
jgi:outer membrane protein OmpA-like peptidoglycan-associated protein